MAHPATRSSSEEVGHDQKLPSSRVALLLIDVVNPMDFEGAESLLAPATRAAENIRRLKQRCRDVGVPVIYVNDNFNRWHLGFRELVEEFRRLGVPGVSLIDRVEPELDSDFYILKPFHSGFFRTGLEVLLQRIGARTLVLTGFAGDICVLFTANDAYMRGFQLLVPADCVASERGADNAHALDQMARLLKADVSPSDRIDLDGLRG